MVQNKIKKIYLCVSPLGDPETIFNDVNKEMAG